MGGLRWTPDRPATCIMPPSTFTAHSLQLEAFSPEQLLEVVRGARFEHYILARSQCDARLDRWSTGAFTVDIGRYSFPVRAIGPFPSKTLCLGYMRTAVNHVWVNGLEVHQDTVEFYPEGSELNYRADANSEWVAIAFDENLLQAAAQDRLGHEVQLPWKQVISFRTPRATRDALDRMVHRLWRHPMSGTVMMGPILGIIAEMLDGVRTEGLRPSARSWQHRKEILQVADRYLRLHRNIPFNLRALADAAGTSIRTLQRTFVDAYGISPQDWARCLSLHGVRERLKTSEAQKFTIETIARECGFRHMGRFAGYYQELFGESPVQTLRRQRLGAPAGAGDKLR